MQYGLFMMPMHLPEKPLAQAFDEDIDLLLRADALGYSEAWTPGRAQDRSHHAG